MMPPIRLHSKETTSPLIDVDKLNHAQKDIINKSVRSQEIMLVDPDGIKVLGSLNDVGVCPEPQVSIEDIDIDQDVIPEMVSVTVDDLPEDKDNEWIMDPKYFDDAKLFLDKHFSTVKKDLKALELTDENLMLLHACLHEEVEGKKRNSVISAIHTQLERY
jgi:hypothetical protein